MCMMLTQIVERMSGLSPHSKHDSIIFNYAINVFFDCICYLIYYLMYLQHLSTMYSVSFLILYGIALATEGWGLMQV